MEDEVHFASLWLNTNAIFELNVITADSPRIGLVRKNTAIRGIMLYIYIAKLEQCIVKKKPFIVPAGGTIIFKQLFPSNKEYSENLSN